MAFSEVDETVRVAYLTAKETGIPKPQRNLWGSAIGDPVTMPWYADFKGLAIAAYMNNKIIGTEVLAYVPVPGEQKGCVEYGEIGRAYSFGVGVLDV